MRLPQDTKNTVHFLHHLIWTLPKRDHEAVARMVAKYRAIYSAGVPLKTGSGCRSGQTYFTWNPPGEKNSLIFLIKGRNNYVQMFDPATKAPFWFDLTSKWTLINKKIFGIPALAAACLFLRDGTDDKCAACGGKHDQIIKNPRLREASRRFTSAMPFGYLRYKDDYLIEWEAEDYESLIG